MKTIVVTGASGSMGAVVCEAMAAAGWHVVMACRNLSKGQSVLDRILSRLPGGSLELRELNLESLDSVRLFASGLSGLTVDALMNNAGIINREYGLTADGYERTFQVNFLGPALLSLLLCEANPGMHVVSMVSLTCSLVRIPTRRDGERHPDDDKATFSQLGTYARAKLAMLLFTLELERRGKASVDVSDPGVVDSNMISMGRWFDPLADRLFRPFCSSPEKGARPAIKALLDASADTPAFHSPRYRVGLKALAIPRRFTSISAGAAASQLFHLAIMVRSQKAISMNTRETNPKISE